MTDAARTLTDPELEAMLERAAERGAARALAAIRPPAPSTRKPGGQAGRDARDIALRACARLQWFGGAGRGAGVYLLLRAGVVAYVGKSNVDVCDRIKMHGREKGHDAVQTLLVRVPADAPERAHMDRDRWLHEIEYALIERFDPQHNARRDAKWIRGAGFWVPMIPPGGPT